MQSVLLIAILLAAVTCASGCTVYDMIFDGLGSRHYSGGGPSDLDRRADFNENASSYGAN
jgi:hypothetical protein